MTTSRKHVAWAGVGLTLALTAGSPAVADDTELLVSNPNSGAIKPNILFILDSSGSMTSIETTQEPYDSTTVYAGSCRPNVYYWTDSSNIPSCDWDNDNFIPKASFVCQQGIIQAAASGSYQDTMAQYRSLRRGDSWTRLRSGNTGLVECKADSGKHGDGNPLLLYARNGTDNPTFTGNSNEEVSWGSNPTDRIYTVYDDNFLNWYHFSPSSSMSRTDIVKQVTKNVLGSINNVNVGIMWFNFDQGGTVHRAVKDLDSTRAAANAMVDSLPASGWTPLSETLYESALYWRGMDSYYGDSGTDLEALEVPGYNALGVLTGGEYKEPAEFACAKNFTVLLTDGDPTQDRDAYSKTPLLPNFVSTMGRASCTGGDVNGACLDDISEYLSKEDINPAVPGEQTVTTYTIGFRVDLPLLKSTAELSGGKYYLAEDVKTLTDALTDIVTNIFDRDVSFTAPAVSVNAFNRTQHLNDMYISVFRASTGTHWPGNLKKYTIRSGQIRDSLDNPAVDPNTGFFADTSKSFWTPGASPDGANVNLGGALSQLPDPAIRKVYTNNGPSDLTAGMNSISTGNIGSFTPADFGLTGAAGEPTLSDIIQWVRGVDVRDIDNDASTTVRRQMGDTLHSQPASIVYGGGALPTDPMDIVVYSATNDGNLHAIDAQTGSELWTFIPKELLVNSDDLFYDEVINYKNYGIDGDIVQIVADRNKNGIIEPGTDFAYIVFGMRRGGDNYYMLDVTTKNSPKLKWVRTFTEFGQSWSPPVVARVATSGAGATSPDKAVLVLGAGYDTVHDQAVHPSTPDNVGAGVFMLDLETGVELWRAGRDNGADLQLPNMTRAIPGRIRVLDMSGDGFADRMYAADLGGQIWRFDIFSGKTPAQLVTGGVIAQLGAEGMGSPGPGDTRRFYNAPDVSLFLDHKHDRRYLSISIGSGYRAHPLDKSADDRFYSLRDPDVFTTLSQAQYNAYPIAYDGDFVEVSGKIDTYIQPTDRGWKFSLPPGEKILAESATFNDEVFFVSFEPEVASADPCQAGLSVNRLYRVSVLNGDPARLKDTLDPNDPVAIDDARVQELEQGGIAPKPTFLFPSPLDPDCQGEECSPPPIGCVGVECFDPGYPNNPVRTLWTQDGIE
ncbi:MAG: PilC/PilY family type IV pilus protein [Gammaproteobacteria bacterium]|nr:PilC/PilY family type IV pilus protein [Gammaproteobacteria bacterium]